MQDNDDDTGKGEEVLVRWPNDPAPGPWIIPTPGQVYSQPLYVPAPFTDSEGVRHEDYMAGLVALVYGGPKTTALAAAAPELLSELEAWLTDAYTLRPEIRNVARFEAAEALIAKARGQA